MAGGADGLVGRYLALGLALGCHVDGLVDAYYGPRRLALMAEAEPLVPPATLAGESRSILSAIDAGEPLQDIDGRPEAGASDSARRRAWLRAQVVGLHTTAEKLSGKAIDYPEEVESCYGVRPHPLTEEEFAAAHRRLEEALPGSGPLRERFVAWREAHSIDRDKLEPAIASLVEDLRTRTKREIGLPEGEKVDFELTSDKPWSGFNYYLGDLESKVAVNTDLPVLSTSIAQLVAHESYPGHHTEHCRKEIGLVRRREQLEESIFLVGTPQCLIAEGLADLGLEALVGTRPESMVSDHLRPLGIRYDADVVAEVSSAAEVLSAARANAAWRLHVDGVDADTATDELARWALLPRERAAKQVGFLVHPTWRSYISCYVEGLPLCRRFVAGDLTRFTRLVSEQMTPADLGAGN